MQFIACILRISIVISILTAGTVQAEVWLDELTRIIEKNHLTKIDKDKLATELINSINRALKKIDKHAEYTNSHGNNHINNIRYDGIGADIFEIGGQFIIMPVGGSPLFNRGVKDFHVLNRINGKSAIKLGTQGITEQINKNTRALISLEVSSIGTVKTRTVKVPKSRGMIPTVEKRDALGTPYIRINHFAKGKTFKKLEMFLREFKKSKHFIIIDLRNNTGGDLYEALDVASFFVPGGKLLVKLVSRYEDQKIHSLKGKRIIEGPVLFLIGSRTASAAEALIIAIQPYADLIMVGSTTYGKCLSQKIVKLSDGSTLRLSNLRVLSVDGSSCEGKGVDPNIPVSNRQLYGTSFLIKKGLKEVSRTNSYLCLAEPFVDSRKMHIRAMEIKEVMDLDDLHFEKVSIGRAGNTEQILCLGPIGNPKDASALKARYTKELDFKFRIEILPAWPTAQFAP